MAEKGIVIQDGPKTMKHLFVADELVIFAELEKLRAKHPTATITILDPSDGLVWDDTFGVNTRPDADPDQAEWKDLKKDATPIEKLLARRVGLK